MRATAVLTTALTLALLPLCLTAGIRIPRSFALEQPSCDDNGHRAHVLFRTLDQARACKTALDTYETELLAAKTAYGDFLGVMKCFEWTQNRLCRWQRLVKEPPETREAHVKAFAPVKAAHERLVGARKALWAEEDIVRRACGGGGDGRTVRVRDVGVAEL